MGQVVPVFRCFKCDVPNEEFNELMHQDPTGELLRRTVDRRGGVEAYGFKVDSYPEGEISLIGSCAELLDYARSAQVAASVLQRQLGEAYSLRATTLEKLSDGIGQAIDYFSNPKQQQGDAIQGN